MQFIPLLIADLLALLLVHLLVIASRNAQDHAGYKLRKRDALTQQRCDLRCGAGFLIQFFFAHQRPSTMLYRIEVVPPNESGKRARV